MFGRVQWRSGIRCLCPFCTRVVMRFVICTVRVIWQLVWFARCNWRCFVGMVKVVVKYSWCCNISVLCIECMVLRFQ